MTFAISPSLALDIAQIGKHKFSLGTDIILETKDDSIVDCDVISTRYGMKTASKKIVIKGRGNVFLNTSIAW